jgi:hypothetical protein
MSTGTLDVEITIDPGKRHPRRRRAQGPEEPAAPRIPRIARLMALAIKFQDMVDRGEVRDYADLARLGYVSRARITQIMNLLNLAPDIQEELLFPATSTIAERHLRKVMTLIGWGEQRHLWCRLGRDLTRFSPALDQARQGFSGCCQGQVTVPASSTVYSTLDPRSGCLGPGRNPLAREHGGAWEESLATGPLVAKVIHEFESPFS